MKWKYFAQCYYQSRNTEKGCSLFSYFKNNQYENPQSMGTLTSNEKHCSGSSD